MLFASLTVVVTLITLVFTLHSLYSPMWYLTEGLIFIMVISPFIGLLIGLTVSTFIFIKKSITSSEGLSKTILSITIIVFISMVYSPFLAYFYAPIIAKEFKNLDKKIINNQFFAEPPMGSGMLAKGYSSLEELAKDTPVIISAKVASENRFF